MNNWTHLTLSIIMYSERLYPPGFYLIHIFNQPDVLELIFQSPFSFRHWTCVKSGMMTVVFERSWRFIVVYWKENKWVGVSEDNEMIGFGAGEHSLVSYSRGWRESVFLSNGLVTVDTVVYGMYAKSTSLILLNGLLTGVFQRKWLSFYLG